MNEAMRALVRSADTGKMVVVEIPVPTPAQGQVLVEVNVSAVNEMDVQVRAGGWARYVKKFLKQGPVVSGFEFAGIARSDGHRIRAGDRVIGNVHVLYGPRTHAEYVCVDENDVGVIPATIPFDHAAALVAMGLTAIEILERLKPLVQGQRVLIIGAAGGVGIYSLQLAKHQGAHVTAVCSLTNAEWVRTMGPIRDSWQAGPSPADDGRRRCGASARLTVRTTSRVCHSDSRSHLARQLIEALWRIRLQYGQRREYRPEIRRRE